MTRNEDRRELAAKTGEDMRRTAKAFVERWTYRRGSEKGEDQQFWNDYPYRRWARLLT